VQSKVRLKQAKAYMLATISRRRYAGEVQYRIDVVTASQQIDPANPLGASRFQNVCKKPDWTVLLASATKLKREAKSPSYIQKGTELPQGDRSEPYRMRLGK
jgi:hypothetical protein